MLYNWTIIDLYDRSVATQVKSKDGITSDSALADPLKALHSQKRKLENLILHFDQGSQFTSN
jgi:transposase InsO family protein